jgi:hypothetical protein
MRLIKFSVKGDVAVLAVHLDEFKSVSGIRVFDEDDGFPPDDGRRYYLDVRGELRPDAGEE